MERAWIWKEVWTCWLKTVLDHEAWWYCIVLWFISEVHELHCRQESLITVTDRQTDRLYRLYHETSVSSLCCIMKLWWTARGSHLSLIWALSLPLHLPQFSRISSSCWLWSCCGCFDTQCAGVQVCFSVKYSQIVVIIISPCHSNENNNMNITRHIA